MLSLREQVLVILLAGLTTGAVTFMALQGQPSADQIVLTQQNKQTTTEELVPTNSPTASLSILASSLALVYSKLPTPSRSAVSPVDRSPLILLAFLILLAIAVTVYYILRHYHLIVPQRRHEDD